MLQFSDLNTDDKKIPPGKGLLEQEAKQLKYNSQELPTHKELKKLFRNIIETDEPKPKKQYTQKEKEELRLMEPGYKVPTGDYQQIGQYCDTCDDTTAHVHDPNKKKLRCMICKTIKYYK